MLAVAQAAGAESSGTDTERTQPKPAILFLGVWVPQIPRPQGSSRGRAPEPCQPFSEEHLSPAPLGSTGAGGVAVGGQDLVGDSAALALVHPFLGPQV